MNVGTPCRTAPKSLRGTPGSAESRRHVPERTVARRTPGSCRSDALRWHPGSTNANYPSHTRKQWAFPAVDTQAPHRATPRNRRAPQCKPIGRRREGGRRRRGSHVVRNRIRNPTESRSTGIRSAAGNVGSRLRPRFFFSGGPTRSRALDVSGFGLYCNVMVLKPLSDRKLVFSCLVLFHCGLRTAQPQVSRLHRLHIFAPARFSRLCMIRCTRSSGPWGRLQCDHGRVCPGGRPSPCDQKIVEALNT